jgi:sodium/hydrogen exchanger-like protein 6/7
MTVIDENDLIEFGQDLRKAHDHEVDTANLLIFTFLLIIVIITIWIFKHKRVPYVHETGLAVIYGIIFGIIIRYGFNKQPKNSIRFDANLTLANILELPEYVYLTVPNHTQMFVYTYKNPKKASLGSEAAMAMSQDYEEKARFDPEIFFNLLLPPIIFHAGYSMKKKHFFKNFGAILMFALLGTSISSFVTG